MNKGVAFEVERGGYLFKIFYTDHFVERYEIGDNEDKARDAVSNHIKEPIVAEKIRLAIPELVKIIKRGDSTPEGIITSLSTGLNLAFAVEQKSRTNFRINMQTMLIKTNFIQKKVRDYKIAVNPYYPVHFMQKALPDLLKDMVLTDLVVRVENMEANTEYQFEEWPFNYMASLEKGTIVVDDANWSDDVWEIEVD